MLINKAKQYLKQQIADYSDSQAKFVNPQTGQEFAKRKIFSQIQQYYEDFTRGNTSTRWIALLGLRGVGKTTLMHQLFNQIKCAQVCKLFISVDHIQNAGLNLKITLDAYEEMLGVSYGQLNHPVYFFIDEIHYDPNWVLTIKTLFDRNPRIFIITTGSSVYSMIQSLTTDAARRVHQEQLHPMSLPEYMMLSRGVQPVPGLMDNLRHLIYAENDSSAAYAELHKLRPVIDTYYASCFDAQQTSVSACIKNYILQGNMPYCIHLQQVANRQRTLAMIKTILMKDLPIFTGIQKSTLGKVEDVLHEISNSLTFSEAKLCNTNDLNKVTIRKILDSFREANILKRVYPFSSHRGQILKPSKYLFVSPTYRDTLLNNQDIPSPTDYEDVKGLLLEDVVQLYFSILNKEQPDQEAKLYYDAQKAGADFILKHQHNLLAIEVGWQKDSSKQVHKTLKRHKRCNRGMITSDSPLKLYDDNIISIPLDVFLLST